MQDNNSTQIISVNEDIESGEEKETNSDDYNSDEKESYN